MSTGYPYVAGYLPDDDGAYALIEVYDALTLDHQRTIKSGLQGEGYAITGTGAAARLYLANTGETTITVSDLTGTLLAIVDTGTSVEDVVVRPSDGAVIARNRMGGSTLVLESAGTVSEPVSPGHWPTKILLDEHRGLVYSLSHYESSVTALDVATLAPIATYDLGVQPLRTDWLSTMAIDKTARRLYAALPELAQVVALDLETGLASAPVAIPSMDPSQIHSEGALQVAANGTLGLVYVLSAPQKKLFVYDRELAAARELDLSADWTNPSLDAMYVDEGAGRVFVGPLVIDAEATQVTGRLPEGDRVLAVYPAGDRLYASGPGPMVGQRPCERMIEMQSSTLTVERRFDLLPIEVIASAFAFDFARGLAYVGYFDGRLDVIRFGAPS